MPEPSKSQDQLTTPLSANASSAVASPVEGATIDGSPRATPLFEKRVEKEGKEDQLEGGEVSGEVQQVEVEADNLTGLESEDIEACDQPLPTLVEGQEEAKVLARQQMEDDSLSDLRKKGVEQEGGLMFDGNGVLVQVKLIIPGKAVQRVVVPQLRRREILELTHKGLVGGHFSHKKMTECLLQHFTWPGLRSEVKRYCAACPDCQRAGRALQPRVPMVETPIILTPYQRLACDLVGPLTRTKSGHKYILTVMCVGTRFPYVVPLKRVDAVTVAEGLTEVISHTGIPKELLTDQGSVFTGKLTKQVCELLSIKHLKTTAYHPQSNGILERWHGALKGMLRKLGGVEREWDCLLKFCLLCYRSTPHTATGFSPFELVHGYPMRGPLEAIKDGWLQGELNLKDTVQWVQDLRNTLTKLHEQAEKNEGEYKKASKKYYDRKARNRSFQKGDMVLLHTPSLTGKLDSIWDGPFEVMGVLSETSYKIAVPNKRSHTQIVHINRLKLWQMPKANLFRVVVGQDSEGSDEPPGKVTLGQPGMTEAQIEELDSMLGGFNVVITDKLGHTSSVSHVIDTGQSAPVQSYPYRIAPAWKEELHDEVRQLLEDGIIIPSHSPWSAPMVPIRKTSGALRLCIDYRKLNQVTVADPYEMPRVDDLLDEVTEATWLSKLDLKRGFYQVPLQADSHPKTAFCTPWGKFCFTRMPFGLKNAPATFQRAMDQTLAGQASFSSTYIDDVLIYSINWEDHVRHIAAVLGALREAGLTATPSKCEWGAHALTYLGYEVGQGKIIVPEARVKNLRDHKQPHDKKGLRAFLGTTGYYRQFIPDYAGRAGPLYEALRKVAPSNLHWDEAMLAAFDYLISSLCSKHVLWLPRTGDRLVLHTDASYQGLGAVLSAERDGIQRPLGYFSRRLLPAERHYAATELECLAVFRAIDHFAVHLVGSHFNVVTDHRALTALLSSTKLNGRLMRWALALQTYDFEITHRTGVAHQNADGLSRQTWDETVSPDHPPHRCWPREGEMLGTGSTTVQED